MGTGASSSVRLVQWVHIAAAHIAAAQIAAAARAAPTVAYPRLSEASHASRSSGLGRVRGREGGFSPMGW
jgi:hypothetical protein